MFSPVLVSLASSFHPGAAAEQARAEPGALRQALDARFSRGEPVARPRGGARLDPHSFQGRRRATRARPRVDRLALVGLDPLNAAHGAPA